MKEKDTQETISEASSSSSPVSGYEILDSMSQDALTVDTDIDEKYTTSSNSGGVEVPSSPTCSDEEEGVPLLEDVDLGRGEEIEAPAQGVAKKSFVKAEYKIALSHFMVSEALLFIFESSLNQGRGYFHTLQ